MTRIILFPDKHLKYGSFARRTKIRPLDDIDLMLCISGEGRTYTQFGDVYCISGLQSDVTKNITFDNTYYLNSTKVINRLLKSLADKIMYPVYDPKGVQQSSRIEQLSCGQVAPNPVWTDGDYLYNRFRLSANWYTFKHLRL